MINIKYNESSVKPVKGIVSDGQFSPDKFVSYDCLESWWTVVE